MSSCTGNRKTFSYCSSYSSSFKVKPNPKIGNFEGDLKIKKSRKKSI
jgi:hypothetical protein